MIQGVGFCPHPPALVPEMGVGTDAELAGLRAACRQVVRAVAAANLDQLVLIGHGAASRSHRRLDTGSLSAFGFSADPRPTAASSRPAGALPLSLTIGAWLVADAAVSGPTLAGFSVGDDFESSAAGAELGDLAQSQSVGLIVMGDGSARRTERAPGYLDERASVFDAHVHSALLAGDADALASLDAQLGTELLAAGTGSWRAAGRLLHGMSLDADVLYSADPFGVAYFAAIWTARA